MEGWLANIGSLLFIQHRPRLYVYVQPKQVGENEKIYIMPRYGHILLDAAVAAVTTKRCFPKKVCWRVKGRPDREEKIGSLVFQKETSRGRGGGSGKYESS